VSPARRGFFQNSDKLDLQWFELLLSRLFGDEARPFVSGSV